MERKERGVDGKKEEREEREEKRGGGGGREKVGGELYVGKEGKRGGEKKEGRERESNKGKKKFSLLLDGEGKNARVVPHQWQEPLCSCVCQHVRR